MTSAVKQVTVRLAAEGGRQVRAELKGIGADGATAFQRLTSEMEAANARADRFFRRLRIAAAAGAAAAATAATAMIRSGLQAVDAQAKLAQSLGTTVESIQTLERAGELAGISMSGIEQATKDLTRRLSQAAAGTGPAADALDRLGLSATTLIALPLDERVGAINAAIEEFVPAAERAAVAGQLFGEEGSIAMGRIDTATLRQATADMRAFGVVVSEQDAAQIERTNDAISRLGLIWRGLANQLAVAAAPALEAAADAMAALAERSGPVGRAIELVLGNLDRLAATLAAVAGLVAGRFVAGLTAAAFSVRGLATALAVLRGALIRLPFVALVIGAQELILRFGRLVEAAGSFSGALDLLRGVAAEVWDRMGIGAQALGATVAAAWAGIRASVVEGVQASLDAVSRGASLMINTFQGAFAAVREIWSDLPAVLGDLVITAANAVVRGVERLLNAVIGRVNRFISGINTALSALPSWAVGDDGLRIGAIDDVSFAGIENRFAGAAGKAGGAAAEAFTRGFERDYRIPDLGLSAYAEDARATQTALRGVADELSAAATGPLESVQAIRAVLARTSEEAEGAADAVSGIGAAFDAVAGGEDGAAGGAGSGGAAGRAATAATEAGAAIDAAGERAASGWDRAREGLDDYATRAMETGRQIGDALVSAFRGAEDALLTLVTKGKVDFRDLANSILEDITRIALRSAVLGPLANWLGGALGGIGGGLGG
ncbi:phage tail tape measure C-terminal domain-containing protein, partial [Roseovarius tibetensis]|uniref:phage tail tape measure C-terminal domain-containing protein n=1 Tax=Roseovarius tibetensis TaxID=2685897 RepID=UPI003D7FECD3